MTVEEIKREFEAEPPSTPFRRQAVAFLFQQVEELNLLVVDREDKIVVLRDRDEKAQARIKELEQAIRERAICESCQKPATVHACRAHAMG